MANWFKEKYEKAKDKTSDAWDGAKDLGSNAWDISYGMATLDKDKVMRGGVGTYETLLGKGSEGGPEADPAKIDNKTLLANQKKKQRARLAGQRSTLLTESNLLLNPRLNGTNQTPTTTLIGHS